MKPDFKNIDILTDAFGALATAPAHNPDTDWLTPELLSLIHI